MNRPSDAQLADWIWAQLAHAPPRAHHLLALAYRAGLIDGANIVWAGLKTSTAHLHEQAGARAARQAEADATWRHTRNQPARRPAAGRPVSTRTGDDRL